MDEHIVDPNRNLRSAGSGLWIEEIIARFPDVEKELGCKAWLGSAS